jgi:hypothetical protein
MKGLIIVYDSFFMAGRIKAESSEMVLLILKNQPDEK